MKNIRELRGQNIALKMLEAYLKGSVPPLLIFHGPDGTGKWSAAEAFIQQKLCDVGSGCGNCPSCRKFQRGEHPDFIRFPAARVLIGEQENAETFTIRWLIRTRLIYTPFEGDVRFVLFPAAELIQNEAETALLKTLEEPPAHTRFIFLVRNLNDLKPTIVSRGVCIPFGLIPQKIMREMTGNADETSVELMGGSLHYLPFFSSPLYSILKEKTYEAVKHPLALARLEQWLSTGERKGFTDIDPALEYGYQEILEIFGLLLLEAADQAPAGLEIRRTVLEFKGELNQDMQGMLPYLTGRLFQKLKEAIFKKVT